MFLTTELIHVLPPADRRVYNRPEAASYLGVSPGYFDNLVAKGQFPPPLPLGGVKRWDKAALDHALNALSGLKAEEPSASAYDAWRSSRGQS